MSRINTNVTSLIAQRVLSGNTNSLGGALERLSTGLRINRGKDDPAGLIASENLRAEARGTNQAVSNAERADQVVGIAEGGLQEIATLLNEVQGLITNTANTAGLSREEKEANQLQIDSILQTIDRVAAATSFQGVRLLNGSQDYTTAAVSAAVSTFRVNGAKLLFGGTRNVNVLVTNSAQLAALRLSFGGTTLNLTSAIERLVIEVAGSKGSRELAFTSGTALTAIAATINTFTAVTGVSATVSATATGGVRLSSIEYGSDAFVNVKIVDDGGSAGTGVISYNNTNNFAVGGAGSTTTAFNAPGATNGIQDLGQDVVATVNGITATTNGRRARINTDFLDVEIELSTTAAQTLGNINAFTITGGGADFQLAGNVDIGGKVSLGIGNVATREIGTTLTPTAQFTLANLGAGRELNVVDGDVAVAQKAITRAIADVSSLRGRLGAFQKNTIGATIRSLGVSVENTIAAESIIRDADFATDTSHLTRSQILVQSATQVLQIANSSPQAVLQLLG